MKFQKYLWNTVVLGCLLSFAGPALAKKNLLSKEGEYLVKLKPQHANKDLKGLAKSFGATQIKKLPGIKSWLKIKTTGSIDKLKQKAEIEFIEPNYLQKIVQRPDDRRYSEQWGLKNNGQKDSDGNTGEKDIDINIESAWDLTTGSADVVVAVIDTGIDQNHEDLKHNMWVNQAEAEGKAGVDDDGNGYVDDIHGYDFVNVDGDSFDDHGHGSHCAGVIGARGNDGTGIAGVNWKVKMMGVKFLSADGYGSTEGAIESIVYAVDNGAKILSNSWGGGSFSKALKESIEYAHAKDVLFLAAAGNDGYDNDEDPHYPSSYEVENIIAVSALNNIGELTDWSNYGVKSVHVAAPGNNIWSTIPGGYDSWSGTSMATPFVSGLAALKLAYSPSLSAKELKEKILGSVRKLDSLKGKVSTGGMIDAWATLKN